MAGVEASSVCIGCFGASTRNQADGFLPRDLKRLRALEVYFLTGYPLTHHFAATVSPLEEHGLSLSRCRLRPG